MKFLINTVYYNRTICKTKSPTAAASCVYRWRLIVQIRSLCVENFSRKAPAQDVRKRGGGREAEASRMERRWLMQLVTDRCSRLQLSVTPDSSDKKFCIENFSRKAAWSGFTWKN